MLTYNYKSDGVYDGSTTEIIIPCGSFSIYHQFGITPFGTVSAGQAAVEVMPFRSDRWEALTYNGTQVILPLTSANTFGPTFGNYDKIRLVISGFSGAKFGYHACGWY